MIIELSNKNGNGAKLLKFCKKGYLDVREAESNVDKGSNILEVGGIIT